jgi:hypothetical protein
MGAGKTSSKGGSRREMRLPLVCNSFCVLERSLGFCSHERRVGRTHAEFCRAKKFQFIPKYANSMLCELAVGMIHTIGGRLSLLSSGGDGPFPVLAVCNRACTSASFDAQGAWSLNSASHPQPFLTH